MGTFDRIAPLPLLIDDVTYERTSQTVSSGFERISTVIVMRGGGHEGRGEDICYAPTDHDLFPAPEALELTGSHTIATLSRQLDGHALFTGEPSMHASLDYRRWAFESAALDLALRQSGATLGEVVGRERAPLHFVVSTPARPARVAGRRARARVQGRSIRVSGTWRTWTRWPRRDACASATSRPTTSARRSTWCRMPDFHRQIAEHFPGAVIEDPSLAADALEALEGSFDRLSFDAPIHSLADVDALPMRVRHLNIKPSRFGPLSRLFECIDASLERGVELYGGGQFELGVGRAQIQEIASLFYPGTPNDVAPPAYNAPEPVAGLPQSPLPPPPRRPGFGALIPVGAGGRGARRRAAEADDRAEAHPVRRQAQAPRWPRTPSATTGSTPTGCATRR